MRNLGTQTNHFSPFNISLQKSPNSPLVPSSIACARLEPYFLLYSIWTFSKCCGSQWNRTRRLTRSSVRSLDVSAKAWWRRRASRTGRLSTPLRICANVSPCHHLSDINRLLKVFLKRPTTRFCDFLIISLAKFLL